MPRANRVRQPDKGTIPVQRRGGDLEWPKRPAVSRHPTLGRRQRWRSKCRRYAADRFLDGTGDYLALRLVERRYESTAWPSSAIAECSQSYLRKGSCDMEALNVIALVVSCLALGVSIAVFIFTVRDL
jgi:hypothetical protein